ncbi:MAG: biosynthetic-type acetolactate synthase large subunit [Planctomycetota bacterium]
MVRKGSEILRDVLIDSGVEVVFGYPGGAVIPIFDVLDDADIQVVLPRHEQGAAHMADGYARATGRLGVCITTSGPGATNLVTGIATAAFDSVPVLALTGQVKTPLIGNDAFQEADTTGITRPITKHNYLVKDVNDLARTLKEAMYIATTGRPGPVLVDLPLDVTVASWDGEIPKKVDIPGYKPKVKGHARQIRSAAEAINAAERPVIYAGGGVIISGASGELAKLAEKGNIPVTLTLLGLGAFPGDDPRFLGMLGMHGTATANYAIQESDLIIAIGARFDDRITGKIDAFAPHARIVHVDIDPSSISKNIQVDIPVVGDAKHILGELNKIVEKNDRKGWFERIEMWRARHPLTYKDDGLKPQYVVQEICRASGPDTVIATEVGQNQMWAAQYYCFRKPRTILSSGGLGTMGYGFPAAIGAQFGCPGTLVWDIAGDGSFQMNIQELATAVGYNQPVKIAILNNGYLGMVRQWQELFFNRRYASTDLRPNNPDFVKVAEAYGAKGIRVTTKEEVRPAIEEAVKTDGPVLLDFMIEREENVFPMVPAGEAIDRMIGGMA